MSYTVPIIAPTKKEILVIRILIIFGIISFTNFFYWFFDTDLIDNKWLYGLLLISISFDSLRVLYIWYHYWAMSIPEVPKLKSKPTVDVLTTYFPGEPYDMVTKTLLAIKNLNYPNTAYLCDEANDPYLKDFCLKHDIKHITRNNRIDAKAGNINNALKLASGEVCVILDPDHIPTEDFLDVVIPYFEDESIGFVQTVQSYYNYKTSLVARGAAEQTYQFYGPVMMTMNTYGTVNAIGANCVFRRKALDSIGGHAAGLSEDLHTAMQLHAKKWKSVYVPQVLTAGLAPDTLGAYYKQQLKWSRGTFELLFTVYPKLFKHFTTRQKIHYGIIPLHYLSGFIILINLLIPIISLLFATTPWKGNIVNLTFIFLPVILSLLTIRIYTQKWVMQKSESGIHLMGGILFITTWWFFIVGCIYTFLRKKIPYLPTPKDGLDKASLKLLFPNLLMTGLSIFAVIYGLYKDFTPFSIIMSGFALLNVYLLLYTLWFHNEKIIKQKFPETDLKSIRKLLAPIKHQLYEFWRGFAINILVIFIAVFAIWQYKIVRSRFEALSTASYRLHALKNFGIFYPSEDNGITNIENVRELENQFFTKFNIISLYVPWIDIENSNYPKTEMKAIYQRHDVAMITWEPWIPESIDNPENLHVFELISSGTFDAYISNMALELKNLKEPVLLRFAHEFDNPFYPWFVNDTEGFQKFRIAWQYIHKIFQQEEAYNVQWIWNPWKSENVKVSFPGTNFVDQIGLNVLNYAQLNQQKQDVSFSDLYQPFKKELSKLPALPVIIAELGSLGKTNKERLDWNKEAFNSIAQYPEIESVVLFYSDLDKNLPSFANNQTTQTLDWTFKLEPLKTQANLQNNKQNITTSKLSVQRASINHKKLMGVNYKKGKNWNQSFYTLNRKTLIKDFDAMKKIGINTIRFSDNKAYNYNVLKLSKEADLQLSFGFEIPNNINWIEDDNKKQNLSNYILNKIKKLQNQPHIVSWNLEGDNLAQLNYQYSRLEVTKQQYAYLNWLENLLKNIKSIDKVKPIIIDIDVSGQFHNHLELILSQISNIDIVGLIVVDDSYLEDALKRINNQEIKYQISQINTSSLALHKTHDLNTPFFLTTWQDNWEFNKITFDGLLDFNGKPKTDYFELKRITKQDTTTAVLPEIKILKPAKLLFSDEQYTYRAMILTENLKWVYGETLDDLSFEWSLIKCNEAGDYLSIKKLNNSPNLKLIVPEEWNYYLLKLQISNHEMTRYIITSLNTPLNQPN